jgi:hypothetical protein
MSDTISIDPSEIIKTTLFKLVLIYLVILQITASQNHEKSLFKNIFIRLITNFIVLIVLEYSLFEAVAYSLGFTTLFFVLAEK